MTSTSKNSRGKPATPLAAITLRFPMEVAVLRYRESAGGWRHTCASRRYVDRVG